MPGPFDALLARLSFWRRRARTRRQLRDLPLHLIADIGLDAGMRDEECAKWPWQGIAPRGGNGCTTENGRRLRAPVRRFAMSDRF